MRRLFEPWQEYEPWREYEEYEMELEKQYNAHEHCLCCDNEITTDEELDIGLCHVCMECLCDDLKEWQKELKMDAKDVVRLVDNAPTTDEEQEMWGELNFEKKYYHIDDADLKWLIEEHLG